MVDRLSEGDTVVRKIRSGLFRRIGEHGMNKIEAIKVGTGWTDGARLLAHTTRNRVGGHPEDDIQRLKWYGLFLRNSTPGFFMLRVPDPGRPNHVESTPNAGGHRSRLWQWCHRWRPRGNKCNSAI